MSQVESFKFGADLEKILHLVSHSLYANKDIFLRELISNASDACDKVRYLAQSNADLLSEDVGEFPITIEIDEENSRLIITDRGIGMNHQDLIEHLGTIAGSGTQKFVEAMQGNPSAGIELIGRFGIGFYSAFMVAYEVVVETRKAGTDQVWRWSSKGDGAFTIEQIDSDMSHGTKIILKMREDELSFLDRHKIENIVTTYSDHIGFPVELLTKDGERERINSQSAIWTRSKDEITREEYNKFFINVAHVGGEPWMVLHNKNEGSVEYINLLYIPSIQPFDLFHPDRRCAVKLYVNKVFITEDNVQLIPKYMRFLRGIVDSSDLPLNISRETLQNNRTIEKIKNGIVKRVMGELAKRAESEPDDYKKFWTNFGMVLKEGLCESMNTENREKLLSLCRFYSSSYDDDTLVGLDEYVSRMLPEQKHIYYLTSSALNTARSSPQLEGFVNRGLEVLIMTDPVDDFWLGVVREYREFSLKSVTRADNDLENFSPKDGNKESDEQDTPVDGSDALVAYFKEIMGNTVKDVQISKKLTDSPVCLAVPDGAMDIRMERFLREQNQLRSSTPKILEVNIKHRIITKMSEKYAKEGPNDLLAEMVRILYAEACVVEGEEFQDASAVVRSMNKVLLGALE